MIKKTNRIQKVLRLDCLKLVMVVILIAIICISCGGGNNEDEDIDIPSPNVKEGVFLDSAVEGIGYNTDTQSDLTDSDGTFKYQEGEIIKFTIGDILIGQASAKEILTPIDLVEGANDETDPTVTNICRFLQTLDNDNNLDNGISIIEAVRNAAKGEAINFDVNQIELENDQNVQQIVNTLTALTSAGQRDLIAIEEAQNHIRIVLNNTADDDGDGHTENQGDCDDTDAGIYPGATEICGDGIDQDCDGTDLSCSLDPDDIDDDGDGYTANQGDCDDTDADIYPGATEICGDGIDQDCDGTDLSCAPDPDDIDNDGDGYTANQGDCDDTDADIYPGATEICGDGIDQDCNGTDLNCPDDITQSIIDNDVAALGEWLDNGGDVNMTALDGKPLLVIASENGCIETAELLISYGANVNNKGDIGCTPLMAAAHEGHIRIVELLISQEDIDLNAITSTGGLTALYFAAGGVLANANSNEELFDLIDLLVSKGADSVTLHLLAFVGGASSPEEGVHLEIFNLLLASGADPSIIPGYESS